MSRRKFILSLVVVLVCGVIALSLPVIVNHTRKTANANSNQVHLCSVKIDDNLLDTTVWQIQLFSGNKVIKTWDEIYQAVNDGKATLTYDDENLRLDARGLLLNKTTEGKYHSVVIYQGYHCELSC